MMALMAQQPPNCQACAKPVTGANREYALPGIGIVLLCIPCRQDYQRVLFGTYPELCASFDEVLGQVRRAQSGFPTSDGMASNADIYQRHVELEMEMIHIWDEFLSSKASKRGEENDGI